MKEKGIATAVIAAVIIIILVVAGIGAYFLMKPGAEEGAPQEGAFTLNTPTSTTENSTVLLWSQSTAADFASYAIYQSTSSGVLGDQITTITDKTTTSFMVTGLSTNTTYYFTVRVNLADGAYEDSNQVSVKTLQEGEEPALVPTNYQTTFPAPTDVFIVFYTDYPPSELFSQTHATVVGISGKNFERPDQEDYYRSITTFFHNAGLRYTGSTLSTFDAYSDVYPGRPDLLEATCIDIDNEKIIFEWENLYWQCTNNPVWREFLLETAKRSIDCGADGVCIDEWLGTYSAAQEASGCFCEYCMQGFREYLKEKYSTGELESFGIEDIDNFDYGDFIREQGTEALQPDFLDYQMASIREFWHESISEIRAYAREKGKDVFSVSANVPDLMANWMPIQNELDYLFSEYSYDYPPTGRSIPIFKLTRSLGKPVLLAPQTANPALLARSDMTTLMKIYTVEAYSARGFLTVPYDATAKPPEGWTYYYADMDELSPYYDFIYNNEQCYENLFSTSKIAVLYSYSSARWSGTNDFYGISNLLLNSHFQYDVLFTGDDDWIEDNLSLSQLNEYEVVILPNTSHLSDIQVSLLLSYAESGGNIFAFGEIGSYDEESQQVERTLLRSLLVEGPHDYGLGRFIYNRNLPPKEEVGGILSGLIQPCIQTNANENVVMLEYWNNETHSIVIHLINYAYDIETEHLSPQENIDLEVVLDPELLGKDLSVSYMSPDWTGIEELSYTLSDGSVEFQVPNLEFYGVASVREASD